jgi:hypothetical protein
MLYKLAKVKQTIFSSANSPNLCTIRKKFPTNSLQANFPNRTLLEKVLATSLFLPGALVCAKGFLYFTMARR